MGTFLLRLRAPREEAGSPRTKTGALTIRVGFGVMLYYNLNTDPAKINTYYIYIYIYMYFEIYLFIYFVYFIRPLYQSHLKASDLLAFDKHADIGAGALCIHPGKEALTAQVPTI